MEQSFLNQDVSVYRYFFSARPPPQPEVDLQGPFQPGSTPIHLESRFMVWNSVGIVKSFNSDEENSIDVEFHDASVMIF